MPTRREHFWRSGRAIIAFICFQIVCQLALLISALGGFRVPIRAAALGAGLLLLVALPGRARPHPAIWPLCAALTVVLVSMLHPTMNSTLAGIAQFALYCAVAAPVFWVARLHVTPVHIRRMIVTLWAFGSLSATLGILQVRFPGRFRTNTSSVIMAQGAEYVRSLEIVNAAGERVQRPSGLTDIPGGAATGAFAAVLFGIGLLLTEHRKLMKVACGLSLTIGVTCLYLAQVRAMMVVTAVCSVALATVLVRRRRAKKLILIALAVAAPLTASLGIAIAVGGSTVSRRLDSLTGATPGEVYYSSRGHFLAYTVTELLPRYPLGAGLGRWGMMNAYFGDKSDPDRGAIWVEIQWTGWLLDGGVPLVLTYASALVVAIVGAWRIANARESGGTDALWLWGALVFAYNVGAAALTFSYPLFAGDVGVQFWLLNAALYAASRQRRVPGDVVGLTFR